VAEQRPRGYASLVSPMRRLSGWVLQMQTGQPNVHEPRWRTRCELTGPTHGTSCRWGSVYQGWMNEKTVSGKEAVGNRTEWPAT